MVVERGLFIRAACGLRPSRRLRRSMTPAPSVSFRSSDSRMSRHSRIEVTEPMGNETMVFFSINGVEVCGRVSPTAGAREAHPLRMAAHLDHMHLIDDSTGKVL